MKQEQIYAAKMIEAGRFASIVVDGKAKLLMFYSVCDEPKEYLENLDHQFLEHNPLGKILVIEEMISPKFGMEFVTAIEEIFCNKYPNLERFMWRRRRKKKDKIFSIGRRHAHAV